MNSIVNIHNPVIWSIRLVWSIWFIVHLLSFVQASNETDED